MSYKVQIAEMPKAEYNKLCREFPKDASVLDANVQFTGGRKAIVIITPEFRQQVGNKLLDRLFRLATAIREEKFLSYFYQVKEILNLPYSQANSILEVGSGKGILCSLMRNFGYNFTTVDLISSKGTDVLANVLHLPFRADSFDVVACFEVLEHLPYRCFRHAIEQMASVARKYVFLSLPFQCNAILFEVQLRIIQKYFRRFAGKYRLFLPIKALCQDIDEQTQLERRDKHNPHYWEVGRKSFPAKRIIRDIQSNGLTVLKRFHNPDFPYHYFILLKVI